MKCAVRWGAWSALAVMLAAFRWVPGLAAAWQRYVSVSALMWLHRCTARVAFPVLEPLLLAALCLCVRRRLTSVVFTVVCMVALLWYPDYWAQVPERLPLPDAEQIERLCARLIGELDASPLCFDPPYEMAGNVAGLPGAVVKPARYPEWMRCMGIAGLFSPWTGEVIVDGGALPALLPFTCVHELMHLKGIADEGEANIAAFRACVQHGGMFADSARLWALRYALSMLKADDPKAVRRMTDGMDEALLSILSPIEPVRSQPLLRLIGIEDTTTSYASLIHYLCVDSESLLSVDDYTAAL